MARRLLMISTDRKIFEEGSAVRARQIAYAKNWDEVHIIIFAGDGYSRQELSENCFAYPTSSGSRFLYPFDAKKIGRELVAARRLTDITCQDASLTAMAGVALKRKFKLPLEIQVHEDLGSPNYGFTLTNRIRRALASRYLPQADHIRVVSNRIKDFLTKRLAIDPDRIEVRPISVDTDRIRTTPISTESDLHRKYPQFDKIVLMVGRLEPEKNFELAIDSWASVLKSLPKAGLIIVGSGSRLAALKKRTADLGIGSSIVFEGWTDKEMLASYYKTADLFLATSLFEGYGMSLVEAKSAGCKLVSTDVGVAREVGAKIADFDAEDVAKKITSSLL